MCGQFLGYWSAEQACAVNSSTALANFNCSTSLVAPFPANTYTVAQLYLCLPPGSDSPLFGTPLFNSCYNSYTPSVVGDPNTTCCGCINWTGVQGISLPTSTPQCPSQPDTSTPYTSNQQWILYIEPTLQWMKAACASYYTFPFDDKSASFGCSNSVSDSINSQGYTITFCPGGNTGLPSTLTTAYDGRGVVS